MTEKELRDLSTCQGRTTSTPCPWAGFSCSTCKPRDIAIVTQQMKKGLEKAASVLEEIGSPPPGLQDLPSVQHYARAMARAARAVLDELR
jgi:hypothetical protein